MKNPSRTGPFGLLIGVVCIVLFYCLIQLAAQGVMGADLLNHKEAPLAALAFTLFGSWGSSLLITCAVIAIFGSLNSTILLFPRVIYAGAKDGNLPVFLSGVHPKYATPHWAIFTLCAISFVVAVSGGFKQLVLIATMSMLLLHLGVVFALIKFRSKKYDNIATGFTIPGGLIIPVAAILVLAGFLFQSTPKEIVGTGILMAVLSIIYLLRYFITRRKLKTST